MSDLDHYAKCPECGGDRCDYMRRPANEPVLIENGFARRLGEAFVVLTNDGDPTSTRRYGDAWIVFGDAVADVLFEPSGVDVVKWLDIDGPVNGWQIRMADDTICARSQLPGKPNASVTIDFGTHRAILEEVRRRGVSR